MSENKYILRIDQLIEQGSQIQKEDMCTIQKERLVKTYQWNWRCLKELFSWEASSRNLISHLVGKKHYYYERFPLFNYPKTMNDPQPDFDIKYTMNIGLGILESLKNEISIGLLYSTAISVTKDILENILFEAQSLLNAGHFPAACIYTRVHIENILKKIADIKFIYYEKNIKLNSLCNKLKEEGIIQLSDWRQILAWIDLGNESAHGNFENCTPQKISQMINGLHEFEIKYLK